MQPETIVNGFRTGKRAALSRAISLAERQAPGFDELFDELFDPERPGRRIGVTGPPGAGKSTLVSGLVRAIREQGHEVGVVAVDPTSPFTGGAVLGDRVRMHEHIGDSGVFIRSMATRGSLGGLARAASSAADLLASFGIPYVVMETVGVGQSEFDVLEAADVVAVVLHPGSGDSVQAMKAGLLELADVFVLNKSDQPGVDRLEHDLQEMLELRGQSRRESEGRFRGSRRYDVPIVRTIANVGSGLSELYQTLESLFASFEENGELARRRRQRRRAQVRSIAEAALRKSLDARIEIVDRADSVENGRPFAHAREILAALLSGATAVNSVPSDETITPDEEE